MLVLLVVGALLLATRHRGPPGGGRARTSTVAETYAPQVFLAPGEERAPLAAEEFLARSSLAWSHDAGCEDHVLARVGSVDPARLGHGGYAHPQADLRCRHGDVVHRSNARTRPFDLVSTGNEGFHLDAEDSVLEGAEIPGGAGVGVPVYVDHVPGRYVTYWFFYGSNDAPRAFLVADIADHEGDWERVSVRLSSTGAPLAVAYFQHETYCVLPWDRVPRSGTHPIVYSARGTHASYPTVGRHPIRVPVRPRPRDVTGRGTVWSTWEALLPVRGRSWYGYGGAWGRRGQLPYSTGPVGPGAFKGSEPSRWEGPAC